MGPAVGVCELEAFLGGLGAFFVSVGGVWHFGLCPGGCLLLFCVYCRNWRPGGM